MRDRAHMRQLPLVLCALIAPAIAFAAEPYELARGVAPRNPQQPQLAIDGQGVIHTVYGFGNVVCYHRSDDGGKTYIKFAELSFAHAMSLGMRRGPRIAVTDGAICITAIGGEQGKGRDGDLLAMRSVDGGKSWTGPATINEVADAAREGLHAMAAGPKGELCCVWLDMRNNSTEVRAAMSLDGGGTWSQNVLVYKSPDGSVCECCHPSIAFDDRGRVHVQWRNSLEGKRDIYLTTSSDRGKTYGTASKLGAGTWTLDACPMDGGAIAVAGGQVSSAWRRDKSVYLSSGGRDQERLLGIGEQPWIAATKDGPFVVWLKKRGDAAYLLTPAATSPLELAAKAFDPVIAAGPKDSYRVVAAWESRDGKNFSIQCQVVSN